MTSGLREMNQSRRPATFFRPYKLCVDCCGDILGDNVFTAGKEVQVLCVRPGKNYMLARHTSTKQDALYHDQGPL
jgi:hypothetical protein